MYGTAANTVAKEQSKLYCPWGCAASECDEYGYCRHLVGFTNDGVSFEPIKPLLRVGREGSYDSGFRVVTGGKAVQAVLKGDKLVNPEREQFVEGVRHLAKLWVSSRVYRPDAKEKA